MMTQKYLQMAMTLLKNIINEVSIFMGQRHLKHIEAW
jgi:hypothetical protein